MVLSYESLHEKKNLINYTNKILKENQTIHIQIIRGTNRHKTFTMNMLYDDKYDLVESNPHCTADEKKKKIENTVIIMYSVRKRVD